MDNRFFEQPILNSAYEYPRQHWGSTPKDNPRNGLSKRAAKRSSSLPIPQPKKRKGAAKQSGFMFEEGKGLSDGKQQY
jgi:type III restriction enzyme